MTTTAEHALFLASRINVLAGREDAGKCRQDVLRLVEEITRAINRPVPPKILGPCTTMVDAEHRRDCTLHHPHQCDTALTAKREDIEVTCPRCGSIHNIEKLMQKHLDKMAADSFTISELYKTILPAMNEYVPLRTLQHWAATSKIIPTGHNQEGDPKFRLADVRYWRDAKPQKAATGAAARRHTT